MGMNLSHGGHLTHGNPVNFSGHDYEFIPYNLNPETEELDYEEIRRIALKERPQMIVAGASAYSRSIDFAKFQDIAHEVGAYLFVDMAHIAGLVALVCIKIRLFLLMSYLLLLIKPCVGQEGA